MTGPITKEMLIGEAVQEYPHCAEILMDAGVHCIGCGGAYFETIEQGLAGHGIDDEEIDRIISDMNRSMPKTLGSAEGVLVTEPAVNKIREFMKIQEKPVQGLRVQVSEGGCSGNQYEFSLENIQKEDDNVIEIDSVKVFMDKKTFDMLKGSTIDYIETLAQSGFKIKNPNAQHVCGCGQSFH